MTLEQPQATDPAALSRFERFAVRLGELGNETRAGKWLQERWLRSVSYAWMRAGVARRMYVEGLDRAAALSPERGVLIVSNHRSFFDQYTMMLALWMGRVPWARHIYFPVRSTFFYEHPAGIAVNLLIGGNVMYPPIYRQPARSAMNREAVDRIAGFLANPRTLVGIHPEGTRNKGDDPYTMLPAQPGVGQIAITGQPLVLPVFINGLSNNLAGDIRANYHAGIRRERPCICVIGEPIDYADLSMERARPAIYKRTADRFRDEILKLGERERALRAICASGAMPDDDPAWLINRPHNPFYTFTA